MVYTLEQSVVSVTGTLTQLDKDPPGKSEVRDDPRRRCLVVLSEGIDQTG